MSHKLPKQPKEAALCPDSAAWLSNQQRLPVRLVFKAPADKIGNEADDLPVRSQKADSNSPRKTASSQTADRGQDGCNVAATMHSAAD
jgi:hypothetical protein